MQHLHFDFKILQNDYTVCPPGWGMTGECATFYRMYYICGGKAWFSQGDQEIQFQKGWLYVLPVMQPYSLRHDVDDPLEVLWFHVELDLSMGMDFTAVEILEDEELYHLLHSIRILQKNPECFQDVTRLFDIFLKRLDERLSIYRTEAGRMRRVLDYIEEHITEDPQVYELAACAGLERSYFTRYFKEIFHMCPRQFIYTRKMSVGAQALLQGCTVKQAAERCGYSDEKAFTRAFKRYMEVTPGQYKKCHIEQP